MSLKSIKSKIISTKKTGKVTRAMEAVSAVKMRKTQERAFAARAYARAAVSILANIARMNEPALSPFFAHGEQKEKTLLILITSDKGLAGAFNSAVLKQADIFTRDYACDVIAVGKKAIEYAERNNLSCVMKETNVSDMVSLEHIKHIADTILTSFTQYNATYILHQNFISTFEQRPAVRQIFPLSVAVLDTMVRDIVPRKGKFSELAERKERTGAPQYLIEPSAEEVMPVLVSQLVHVALYHTFLESKACEHSARMVAMKNATDKAKEMVRSLTIQFNKARQAAITAEVSEITAGAQAMEQ